MDIGNAFMQVKGPLDAIGIFLWTICGIVIVDAFLRPKIRMHREKRLKRMR